MENQGVRPRLVEAERSQPRKDRQISCCSEAHDRHAGIIKRSILSVSPTWPLTYNARVPSPFTHLTLAQQVLVSPDLPEPTRALLNESLGAFLFGNTAPDFVSHTNRPRASSHFFDVPMRDRRPAHLRLLEHHPSLSRHRVADPRAVSFLAGYFCHLWVDQLWISNIFEPFFGVSVRRGSFRARLRDHNLLRAHIDLQDESRLTSATRQSLAKHQAQAWLPFATLQELSSWLDHLVSQVGPDGKSRTIEVFSRKSGVSAKRFRERLSSPEFMDQAIFRHLPAGILGGFRMLAVQACVGMTAWYLGGGKPGRIDVNGRFQDDMIIRLQPEARISNAVD